MSDYNSEDELSFDTVAADAENTSKRLEEEAQKTMKLLIADAEKIKDQLAANRAEEERIKREQTEAEERRCTREFLARVRRKMQTITRKEEKPDLLVERHVPEKTFKKFVANKTLRDMFNITLECTWAACKKTFPLLFPYNDSRRCSNVGIFA